MLTAPCPGRSEVDEAAQASRPKPKELVDGFSSAPQVEFSPLACGLTAAPSVPPHGGKPHRARRAAASRDTACNTSDDSMLLYRDAEAVRLKTPPCTGQRLAAGAAEGLARSPLRGGLQLAPEAAQSPLFLGLYSDTTASPSRSQRHRQPRGPKCGVGTPTTAGVSRSPASGGLLYEPEPEQSSTDP